ALFLNAFAAPGTDPYDVTYATTGGVFEYPRRICSGFVKLRRSYTFIDIFNSYIQTLRSRTCN
ncbi:MAG TPA: hypothetical protein VF623_02775, partial [Segetibacter sp.]